jgi:beta-glucosidase
MSIQKIKQSLITLGLIFSINYLSAQNKFIWGVASASYQVEGAYKEDGKGESNWDVYTNKYHVTASFTKTNQTGNVSVDQYHRAQYLKDFALMKRLGVNTYRFSISWARILPSGTGAINQKGIDHYKKFINDLLSFGIEPAITLYHWDMPQGLQAKGGWSNPESVKWFTNYSNIIFKAFGKKVKTYITFNEPQIDLFLITPMVDNVINKQKVPSTRTSEQVAKQAQASHYLLLASAIAIKNYHNMHPGGQIGITFSLIPAIPKDANNPDDIKAATIQDGVHNRWFLDASMKGTYPEDILALFKKYNPSFKNPQADMEVMKQNPPDFLGVNFYSPSVVTWDTKFPMNANWMTNNPDTIKMFNGYVRPDYLYKLLMRLKNEYTNPALLINRKRGRFWR